MSPSSSFTFSRLWQGIANPKKVGWNIFLGTGFNRQLIWSPWRNWNGNVILPLQNHILGKKNLGFNSLATEKVA